jgi:AbrB family looped-hinge helix DNA binding protein
MSAVLTLGDRGRVVIPQKIREAEGLNPGDKLILFRDENGMTLMTRDQLEQKVWANIKDPGKSLVDELIADRRAEAQRDLEECQREALS